MNVRDIGVWIFVPLVALFGCRNLRFPPAPGDVVFQSGGLDLKGRFYAPEGGGRRPVIILSHGSHKLGKDHILYREMARRLAEKGYWVLTFDFRGFGDSEDPPPVRGAGDMDFAKDLEEAVAFVCGRFRGEPEVVLVGHSLGGGVALAAGARDERVSAAVAVAPPRRARETLFGPDASRRKRENFRKKLAGNMEVEEPVPMDVIEAVFMPLLIENYAGHMFKKPLLLIDGERESEEDRLFLSTVCGKLKGKTDYVTIAGADHYFGARPFGDRVLRPEVIGELVDAIDRWIREN